MARLPRRGVVRDGDRVDARARLLRAGGRDGPAPARPHRDVHGDRLLPVRGADRGRRGLVQPEGLRDRRAGNHGDLVRRHGARHERAVDPRRGCAHGLRLDVQEWRDRRMARRRGRPRAARPRVSTRSAGRTGLHARGNRRRRCARTRRPEAADRRRWSRSPRARCVSRVRNAGVGVRAGHARGGVGASFHDGHSQAWRKAHLGTADPSPDHGNHVFRRHVERERGQALGGALPHGHRCSRVRRVQLHRLVRRAERRRGRARDRHRAAALSSVRPGELAWHDLEPVRARRGDARCDARIRVRGEFRRRRARFLGDLRRAVARGADLLDVAQREHRGLERARDGHLDDESRRLGRRVGRRPQRSGSWATLTASGRLSQQARRRSHPRSCSTASRSVVATRRRPSTSFLRPKPDLRAC